MNPWHIGFSRLETAFNVAAAIPLVGLVSSPIRILAGKVEAVVGGVLAGYAAIGMAINGLRANPNPASEEKFKRIFKAGAEYVVHGALNIARGKAELVGSVFLGVPNLIALGLTSLFTSYPAAPIVPYGIFGENQAGDERNLVVIRGWLNAV